MTPTPKLASLVANDTKRNIKKCQFFFVVNYFYLLLFLINTFSILFLTLTPLNKNHGSATTSKSIILQLKSGSGGHH
jgi:hypothetical protein